MVNLCESIDLYVVPKSETWDFDSWLINNKNI